MRFGLERVAWVGARTRNYDGIGKGEIGRTDRSQEHQQTRNEASCCHSDPSIDPLRFTSTVRSGGESRVATGGSPTALFSGEVAIEGDFGAD
jgi:hypothetical protein